MIASLWPSDPLPGDPSGKRLCEIFGRYLWQTIQAEQPAEETEKPKWQTITAYPLRPRVLWAQWQDAAQLVGVRFGHTTRYALIDIDAGSRHHSPDEIAQLRAALETIGITRTLLLRSSWSGGLHLYIPLPEEVKTFDLAVAMKECCKAQGFGVEAGQLEIFPNVKAYGVSIFVEYNAHRLPLQPGSGSCLLDDAFQPVTDHLGRFLWVWDGAAQAQDMAQLHQALVAGRNAHRKRPKRRSLSTVEAWRTDLEAEITEGWTDQGQTNALLKSIACYGRVFERLEGQALIGYIERIAASRPGYEQYCRHQSEIHRRAIAWARAAENYYWPLGSQPKEPRKEITGPNGNELRSQEARDRIQAAVDQLMALGQLPDTVRGRIKALVALAQTSMQTLYKHLGLWHPSHQPVTVEGDGNLGDLEGAIAPAAKDSNPSQIKMLHTSEKIMKGVAALASEAGSEFTFTSFYRGVRGEKAHFPQPPQPIDLPILLAEIQIGLQQQVQRLSWSAEQMAQFIAQKFEGRRRSELQDNELMTLLYYLQTVDSSLSHDL